MRFQVSAKISAVVRMLANGETLPPQFRDHALVGDLVGFRDCHIEVGVEDTIKRKARRTAPFFLQHSSLLCIS